MSAYPSDKPEGNGLPSDRQSHKPKLNTLMAKGGIMFFAIERYPLLYRGAIMLSPVLNSYQKRSVYIKEYRYKDHAVIDNLRRNTNETL